MRRCLPAFVLAVVCATPAAALDLPARKAGLWEIKMTLEDAKVPGPAMQQCVDAATDKLLHEKFSVGQESCSKHEVSRSGGTIVIDSEFEGDFDSAYTVKVSTTREGGAKHNMTMQAKWLGPCKADQKPGDVEMPGGVRINILDMSKTPGGPQR
jgi:uncharacterized protein DUF3617